MPPLAAVQATIDGQMNALINPINGQQQKNHGRLRKYYQGIFTTPLASIPNNTTAGALQQMTPNLAARPTDQVEDWNAFAIPSFGGPMPFSLEIETYGLRGQTGYVMHSWMRHTNQLYVRSYNVGSQTYRERPWRVLIPPV